MNRGVIVSEDRSSAEIDVQLYGPATQLSCVLDGGDMFACKRYCNPPYTVAIMCTAGSAHACSQHLLCFAQHTTAILLPQPNRCTPFGAVWSSCRCSQIGDLPTWL